MTTANRLDDLTDRINRALVAGLDPAAGTLSAAMHYALSVPGKRLRPLLLLSLLECWDRPPEEGLEVAAAIEMIHTYSLIHDDLPAMDDDDLRRGQPTVHRQFNEAIALLAGDTLLTLAFERITTASLPAEKTVAILREITRAIGLLGMAGGQALDLEFSGTVEQIEPIHKMKTGALIEAVFVVAALLAGLDARVAGELRAAGQDLGAAFQLADDLLDLTGDEAVVGKALHKDDRNRSPNAAIYFGREEVERRMALLAASATRHLDLAGANSPNLRALARAMVYRSK